MNEENRVWVIVNIVVVVVILILAALIIGSVWKRCKRTKIWKTLARRYRTSVAIPILHSHSVTETIGYVDGYDDFHLGLSGCYDRFLEGKYGSLPTQYVDAYLLGYKHARAGKPQLLTLENDLFPRK